MGAGGTAVAAGMSEDKKKKQKEKESLLAMKGEAGKAQKYAAGAPDRAKQAAKDEEARHQEPDKTVVCLGIKLETFV